jgi:hypothetical protein
MTKSHLPAVSRELEFIANHIDDALDIWNNNVKVSSFVKRLSDAVYGRADADAKMLLDQIKPAVENGARSNALRINNWHKPRDEWEVYSEIYLGAKGPKKSVGWAGLHVGYGKEEFRLIGFMNLRRGGVDGRKRFASACKQRIKQVHLTTDDATRYAGWADCVIWFEKKLTSRLSLEELHSDVTKQTRVFLMIAKPPLT